MASPGELVRLIAEVVGVSEATVVQHDRNLAAAGLRSKGGRGTSAAKMTPRDAAHLLIATVASPLVKDSVQALNDYSDLKQRVSDQKIWERRVTKRRQLARLPMEPLRLLPSNHTFADALAALISAARDGSLPDSLREDARSPFAPDPEEQIGISLYSPFAGAWIRLKDVIVSYGEGSRQEPSFAHYAIEEVVKLRASAPDLKQERKLSGKTIFALGKCLAD